MDDITRFFKQARAHYDNVLVTNLLFLQHSEELRHATDDGMHLALRRGLLLDGRPVSPDCSRAVRSDFLYANTTVIWKRKELP